MPISATVVGDRGYVWDAEGKIRSHRQFAGKRDLYSVKLHVQERHGYVAFAALWEPCRATPQVQSKHCHFSRESWAGMLFNPRNVSLYAEHKQHNSAGGLPCELNPEELQLALRQGELTCAVLLQHHDNMFMVRA